MTTAPAPTKAYSPSVMPHTMVALAPIVAPRRTRVRRYSSLRATAARGLWILVKTMLGPQNRSVIMLPQGKDMRLGRPCCL